MPRILQYTHEFKEQADSYRYDTDAELQLLNEIWELDGVFTNYYLPQQKLVFKQRKGATVTKRHDKAQTPHQRAIAHPKVNHHSITSMNAAFGKIKPAALSRQILALTGKLEILAQAKKAPRAKPRVNTSWNNSDWPRRSHEGLTQAEVLT